MRPVWRALPVAALALASAAACAGTRTPDCGDAMGDRTMADGRAASRATVGDIPGYEILVPATSSQEPTRGAICRLEDGEQLTGIDAFRAGQAATHDPYQLAVLAMAVLERGVVGKDPWRPGGEPVPGAEAPKIADGTLVYWRRHEQLANWMRVTVDTATGEVSAVMDNAIQAPAGTELERARAALAASTIPERQGAVRTLAASEDPAAIELLITAARSNEAPLVRQEAARQLGERARPGAAPALVAILGADAHAGVRAAAATALGKLGDASAKDALTRAAADPDPAVQAAVASALTRLGR